MSDCSWFQDLSLSPLPTPRTGATLSAPPRVVVSFYQCCFSRLFFYPSVDPMMLAVFNPACRSIQVLNASAKQQANFILSWSIDAMTVLAEWVFWSLPDATWGSADLNQWVTDITIITLRILTMFLDRFGRFYYYHNDFQQAWQDIEFSSSLLHQLRAPIATHTHTTYKSLLQGFRIDRERKRGRKRERNREGERGDGQSGGQEGGRQG